ncbi:MAG: hypothetical protein ACK5LM_00560 [Lactovum sp.]
MYISAENIEDFLSQVPDKELLVKIGRLIQETTDYSPEYWNNGHSFSCLSFGQVEQKDNCQSAGKIGLTGQKNEVAIYFDLDLLGDNFLSPYQTFFPKSLIGKSCIKIRNVKALEKYQEKLIEIFKKAKSTSPLK